MFNILGSLYRACRANVMLYLRTQVIASHVLVRFTFFHLFVLAHSWCKRHYTFFVDVGFVEDRVVLNSLPSPAAPTYTPELYLQFCESWNTRQEQL